MEELQKLQMLTLKTEFIPKRQSNLKATGGDGWMILNLLNI